MQLAIPVVGTLGWPELIIVLLVVLLIFGGKKLPEIARGTGRALRIFKSETKGLMHEDDESDSAAENANDTNAADSARVGDDAQDVTDGTEHAARSSEPPQITGSASVQPAQTAQTESKPAPDPHHQPGR